MKKLLFFAGLILASCNQNPSSIASFDPKAVVLENTMQARDGVFVHITESYNDPHRVLMPLKMADLMSNDKDVIVYLDIHAVELLVRNAKDINFEGFESMQTYIKHLLDKNVDIYVCPTCLSVAGFKPADVMDGVKIAEKEKFFNFTNGRIITLNY